MSWCISIVINEMSKKKALKLLDKITSEIKAKDEKDDIFVEGPIVDDPWGKMMEIQRFNYDSYRGTGGHDDATKKFSGKKKPKAQEGTRGDEETTGKKGARK